nr:hypothetical protein Itr_chr01CG18200 [Ipomoea trifida]
MEFKRPKYKFDNLPRWVRQLLIGRVKYRAHPEDSTRNQWIWRSGRNIDLAKRVESNAELTWSKIAAAAKQTVVTVATIATITAATSVSNTYSFTFCRLYLLSTTSYFIGLLRRQHLLLNQP